MAKIQVQKINTLTGHKDCVYSIERSGQSNVFYSGAGDGFVVSWDLEDPENGQLLARLPASVYAIHYASQYNKLIVGQNFQGIHIIDVDSHKEEGSLQCTKAAIFDIKSWENLLFIATGEGKVLVVDYKDLRVLKTIPASEKSARTLALHPERRELAVGFSDHKIRIYNLVDFSLKQEIAAHKNSVFTLTYSPDYRYLLSGSRDAHLKIWQVGDSYTISESIVAHMYTINHIDYSPDGQYFVTCSMDKSIKVWDARQFRLLKVIDKARHAGHGTSVNKLYWSDWQNQLLSCSDDRTISVWDLKL